MKNILIYILLLVVISSFAMPIVFMYLSTMGPLQVFRETGIFIVYGFFVWFFGRAIIETSFKKL